jgi:hypothetical protein
MARLSPKVIRAAAHLLVAQWLQAVKDSEDDMVQEVLRAAYVYDQGDQPPQAALTPEACAEVRSLADELAEALTVEHDLTHADGTLPGMEPWT